MISSLFLALPCFDVADETNMIHAPSTKCYGDTKLVLLSIGGICGYSAATVYVLGFAFWSRKDIIQFPENHEASVVESTYKAFGFLFYGT